MTKTISDQLTPVCFRLTAKVKDMSAHNVNHIVYKTMSAQLYSLLFTSDRKAANRVQEKGIRRRVHF